LAAAALALISSGAAALGLGRVNVQSVLGEPLRAEIEVTSLNAEEASSLKVNLASPDAFRAAGVDYNSVLVGAKLTLSSRGADRTPVLVLTSDRTVQEPFVDVIVDFAWSTGRLTRSYTLLIDPPGRNVAAQPATAPVAPVFSSPTPAARAAAPAPSQQPAQVTAPVAAAPSASPAPAPASHPATTPRTRATAPVAPVAATESTDTSSGNTVKVHPGDTLSSIATAKKEAGVSLDQMLVSLFRNNPQAFVEDNMNRMKSGVTLSIPSAETAKQLTNAEARQVIQAQSADFAAYRQRLASGVTTVKTDEGTRHASGKVEAKVEDQKTAAAPTPPEKLTLSHGTAKPGTVTQEAKISKETQRQAEAARVAELSRNVAELKKLSADTHPTAAAPAAKTPPATAPAAAPALPAVTVARATPPAPTPAPAVAPTPAPAAVSSTATPAAKSPVIATLPPSTPTFAPTTALVPAASAPSLASSEVVASASAPVVASAPVRPARPHVAPAPAPVEEESLLSTVTDSPYVIPGLLGLAGVIGGLLFWRKRSGGRGKFGAGETSFMESKIAPDSFFGASGGQRVDTRDGGTSTSSSSLNYSLSQLDAIGDVDPVAEADVYLAYGRDLQAEEILKEAQRSDPDRLAIRTKLLEVYAKRADLRTFESQARQLRDLTNGHGEDWLKAQELGRQIDPTNPLYRTGAETVEDTEPTPLESIPEHDADATLIRPPSAAVVPRNDFETTDLPLPIDFDEEPAPKLAKPVERQPAPVAPAPVQDMPFEISDFKLDPEPVEVPIPAPTPAPAAQPAMAAAAPARRAEEGPASMLPPSVDFDFGDLSLDLEPSGGKGAEHAVVDTVEAGLPDLDLGAADDAEPMARKIELADEFRRIGDHEGARELLEEVVSKADGPLRNRAQALLEALG
jgi:pilus assembly protein FimV